MGSLDDRDLRSIAGARRRALGDARAEEEAPSDREDSPKVIDLDRDPAPELPKMITLPRDVVLTTLREVQDFSFRRALWGRRIQARPFRR